MALKMVVAEPIPNARVRIARAANPRLVAETTKRVSRVLICLNRSTLIFIIGRQPWPAIAAADDFDGSPESRSTGWRLYAANVLSGELAAGSGKQYSFFV